MLTKRYVTLLLPPLILTLIATSCGRRSDSVSPTARPSSSPETSESLPESPEPFTPTTTSKPPPTATELAPTSESDGTSEEVDSEDTLFASPEYGVQAFMWWRPDLIERNLELVQNMNFGWVKHSFAWRDIETLERGKYDWWRPDQVVNAVDEAGLKLMVRVDRQPFWSQEPGTGPLENAPPADLTDFGRFCKAMAERYRGRIAAYQVWNEPNLSREWGDQPPDPVEYTELLRVCYEAIKRADPAAVVISAGLAPTGTGLPAAIPDTEFLQGMYDAGAGAYFDVLGLNAPGYKAPPETSPEEGESTPEYGGGRWFVFRHVEDMREVMLANGDANRQVAILELGWTTDTVNPNYAWHAVTEEQQADYLVRAYRYAAENWQPWIGPIVTIYIADFDWTPEANEQWWWSIVLPDGTLRPAYYALRDLAK